MNRFKLLIVFLVALILVPTVIPEDIAYAKTTTYNFSKSSQSSRSMDINIPNLVKINSVKVNTGNVSFTRNGDNVRLNVSNGSYVDRDSHWDDKYYSYNYSTTETNSSNVFSVTKNVSNITNSNGLSGFSGTLSKSGSSYVSSGSFSPADSKTVTVTESGKGISESLDRQYKSNTWTKSYNEGGFTGTLTGKYSSNKVSEEIFERTFRRSFLRLHTCGSRYSSSYDKESSSCKGVTNSSFGSLNSPSYYINYIERQNPNYNNVKVHDISWSGDFGGPYDPARSKMCLIQSDGSCKDLDPPEYYSHDRSFSVGATYDEIVRKFDYNVDYTGKVDKPSTDTRRYTQNYSGTLYKGDYRYSNYKYAYTVTVDYIDNLPPEVSLNTVEGVYSQIPGYNIFKVSGKVSDREGDSSTIRYRIGNQTGILDSGVASGSSWSGEVTVTSSIPEGNPILYVWADDGRENGSGDGFYNTSGSRVDNEKTTRVTIDKTGPVLGYTLSPEDWTVGDVGITASASDTPAGVKIKTGYFEVDSNGDYKIQAEDNVGNASEKTVNVGNIDRFAPTIKFNKEKTDLYEKYHEVSVDVKDTKDGVNDGSGVQIIEYLYSEDKELPKDGWKDVSPDKVSVDVGRKLKTPVGVTGDYYLHVRSVDALGQESSKTSSGKILVDNTLPETGKLGVKKSGAGGIEVEVEGAKDGHSGLDKESAYKFFAEDSSGKVTESPWVSSLYVFNKLKGNESYEVSYAVRDKAGNRAEGSNKEHIYTLSYNPSDLSLDGMTPDSLVFNIGEDNNVEGGNPDGSSYEIYLKNEKGDIVSKSKYSNVLTGRKLSGLEVNMPYIVWSSVKNREGDLTTPDKKMIDKIFTASTIPDLIVKDIKEDSINIDVKTNGNPSGTEYYIQRSINKDFSGNITNFGWFKELEFEDKTLKSGTDYYYRIKSRNGDKVDSEWSKVYEYKTLSAVPVLKGLDLAGYESNKSKTGIKINWSSVVGAEKYFIYRDGKKIEEVSGNETSFLDYVAPFNEEYSYSVSSWNSLGADTDDTWISKGESKLSNTLKKISRARDALDLEVEDITKNDAVFEVINDKLNKDVPETYVEVRERDSGKVVGHNNWSTDLKGRKIKDLKYGIAYEVWIITRNKDNIENPPVKIIEEFYMNRPPEIEIELEDVHNGLVDNKSYAKYSEVKGYDFIQVRGKVLDLDIIPVGDLLKLTYTIKNSKGDILDNHDNVYIDTLVATGKWEDLLDSKGNFIDIPLTDNLVEGYYSIEVTVEDDLGEIDVGKARFLVDRSDPYGELIQSSGNKKYGIDLEGVEIDGDISGVHDKGYSIEYKVNNGDSYSTLFDYQKSNKFNHNLDVEKESNTKFSYRLSLRDQVGHIYKTNIVEYISAINVIEKENYYVEDRPSTIKVDWSNPLDKSDGLYIEISRNGSLIAVVDSGSSFEDKNLDYERDYSYDFVVVGEDENGNKLKSEKVTMKLSTGNPLLIVDAPNHEYDVLTGSYLVKRPLFTDKAVFNTLVEFKQGGSLNVKYKDDTGKVDMDVEVQPNILNKIRIEMYSEEERIIPIDFYMEKNGISMDVENKVSIKEVVPYVKVIKDYSDFYK